MHVRRRAAAVLAVTGLTAALLPFAAGSAQADPTGPSYAFLNGNGLASSSTDRLYATTSMTSIPRTLLTPGAHVFAYDISDDGNTLLVNGRGSSLAASPYNGTYGLLLTRRDPLNPSSVTTRSLSTWVDEVRPVLSADGSLAYWMEDGVIYRYSVLAGGNAVAVSTRFKPASGEQAKALSISPDGTKAAVVYFTYAANGEPTTAKLKAAALASGVGPAHVESAAYGSGSAMPTILEWTADSSEVVYVRIDERVNPSDQVYRVAPGGAPAAIPALERVVSLHLLGSSWYVERYVGGRQLGTTTDLATAPTDWTAFEPGTDRPQIVPSTAIPPVVATPVNRARTTAYLLLSSSDILQNKSTGFASLATYLTDTTGQRTSDDLAQVRIGTLYSSTDGGKTFTKLQKTYAGATLLPWPGGIKFGNGRITAARNLWLRWCFEGDVFATPDCSVTKKLTVHPYVWPGVGFSGGKVLVNGSTSRKDGTAVLSKLVGGSYRVIASAPVSNKRYSFGFRSLTSGTYQISIKADASYGVGIARFRLIV